MFSELSVVMCHDSKADPMGPALIHPAKNTVSFDASRPLQISLFLCVPLFLSLSLSRASLTGLPLLSRIYLAGEKEWHPALVPSGLFPCT